MSSIKNVKPERGSFKQGYYKEQNDKYVGPKPIIYRSSWEYKFMVYCDKTDDVIEWSSEPVKIKYYNPLDKKFHYYYPDFYMKVKLKDGLIKKYIVEIKPSAQLKKPKQPKRITERAVANYNYAVQQFIKNKYKAEAAKKVSASIGMEYIILTEKSLKNG
jgi:hypothetical protein